MKKPFDLEERTYEFARDVRRAIKFLPKSATNIEDSKQLTKSSGSVGANYIEANEGFSPKDTKYRFKVSRKEAKESAYWIRLIISGNDAIIEREFEPLFQEAVELKKIFTAIINKK